MGLDNIYFSVSTLNTEIYNVKKNSILLSPNPSSDFIKISNLTKKEDYKIYNIIGAEIKKGPISNNQKLDISKLSKGIYVIKFENGNALKFIKK
ncbi:hypothetical protein APS56_14790 [Pseudalgibacter alginicilyticus]|uniref:Secretion system C-terminal sorting domain-containing protein n=1 Tax=Pseudalgibacter alginicilyticus TaxID=1736674 RepID=A0A0P0DE52_9FLAO|nr:hypothetical protein APS56_14790 [Pseudalgibacter alginicilyticus]